MEGKAVICSVGDLMLCDSPLYVSEGREQHISKQRANFRGLRGELPIC